MPEPRKLLIDLAAMAVIALITALIGPFGSYAMPFATRLLYWGLMAFAGYWIYAPLMGAAIRLARRLELPEAAAWISACLFATIPMTVAVWAAGLLWQMPPWLNLPQALSLYGHVLVIGGAVSLFFWFSGRNAPVAAAPEPMAEPAAPPSPPFLDRLPTHLGTALLALEMEDHYVRAHTGLGSALILMRMRDAVAELGGIDGMQVHRSWWVARDAVTASKRDGRNLRLVLSNGAEVPVARNSVAELRAAGWV